MGTGIAEWGICGGVQRVGETGLSKQEVEEISQLGGEPGANVIAVPGS